MVVDNVAIQLDGHLSIVVRQAKPARGSDRNPARCVEAEKPHAASARPLDVGSDIQLGKGKGYRKITRPNATHPKRYNTDPTPTIKCIQIERAGNQWSHHRRTNRPMQEQEIMPSHRQSPRGCWERPRAMGYLGC